MEREELGRRLNAIAAYMGGPKYLKEKHFSHLMDVEFELIGLDDLKFHESWDWLIYLRDWLISSIFALWCTYIRYQIPQPLKYGMLEKQLILSRD